MGHEGKIHVVLHSKIISDKRKKLFHETVSIEEFVLFYIHFKETIDLTMFRVFGYFYSILFVFLYLSFNPMYPGSNIKGGGHQSFFCQVYVMGLVHVHDYKRQKKISFLDWKKRLKMNISLKQ